MCRQESLKQAERERRVKYKKQDDEREVVRSAIRDKVRGVEVVVDKNDQILLKFADTLLFVDNMKRILEHILYSKNFLVYSSNIQKKFFTIQFFINV